MEAPAYKGPNIVFCGACYLLGAPTDVMLALIPAFPLCTWWAAAA